MAPKRFLISFVYGASLWQCIMCILFGLTAKYSDSLSGSNMSKYPFYQDVHVMVYVGFGFLMTFMKKYGSSAVAFNFLISAFAVEWALLMKGYWVAAWHDGPWHKIEFDILNLIQADFAAASMMITFGALLGKVSPFQMLLVIILGIFFMTLNEEINVMEMHAVDMGGSMYVHTFGAYFGLAISWMITKPSRKGDVVSRTEADKNSDLFAMIGTLFLWMFWPSFNGALASPPQQHRVVINTVLALIGSCVASFVADAYLRGRGHKFSMVSIQNATLAGGVAVGSSSDLVIQPWGALLTGVVAGIVSVFGYTYIQPFLARKIGLDDTCGVHNLHGLPGIMGGIGGIISAADTGNQEYGQSVGTIFPRRNGPDGWSASEQAQHQLAALVITLAISIFSGLATGFLLKFFTMKEDAWYDDSEFWIEEGEDLVDKGDEKGGHKDGDNKVSPM